MMCAQPGSAAQRNAERHSFRIAPALPLFGTIRNTSDMEINWIRNPDSALAEAKKSHRPVLLDFSAAPM